MSHGLGFLLGGAPAVELHAEIEAHLGHDLFDLAEALAAEVLGFEHLGFALLDELTDEADVGVLKTICGADREFELGHGAVKDFVELAVDFVGGGLFGFEALVEVDEHGQLLFEDLGGEGEGVFGGDGAVGPDLNGELVVVSVLSNASVSDSVVDLRDGRKDSVDRDGADRHLRAISDRVSAEVAFTLFNAELHLEGAAIANRGDVEVRIQDLSLGVDGEIRGTESTGPLFLNKEGHGLRGGAEVAEADLFEVEDDLGDVFFYVGDVGKFVKGTLDPNSSNRAALEGAEQDTTEGAA